MDKNIIQTETDKWWFSHDRQISAAVYQFSEEGTANALRELMNARFEAGARWAMLESMMLSPHIAKFIEMMILLGVYDAETVAEAKAGGSSEGEGTDAQEYLPGMRDDVRVRPASSGDDADDMRSVQLADHKGTN